MNENEIAKVNSVEAFPKRRGRPPGYPKTGGRKPGRRNHVSADAKSDIRGVLDRASGKVWRRICAVALGYRVRFGRREATYPSEGFQRDCLRIIAAKTLPDLQSQALEMTGRLETADLSDLELAKWITSKLEIDAEGQQEPAAIEAPVETPEHDSAEQSQADRAERAVERLSLSKPIAPPLPPADPQQRLNRYIDQQIDAQRTRPRAILGPGHRR